ncbi:MAG: leucyl aminopeptidase family protein [Rhodospirillaceae bacterium]|nr:leucyl aminopeptidase family protein [Rhodospirillaceae bacterium]
MKCLTERPARGAVPIAVVTPRGFPAWLARQPRHVAAWVRSAGFRADPGRHLLLPGAEGALGGVLLVRDEGRDPWSFGALPRALPEGVYRLEETDDAAVADDAALGWALGAYAFTRYRKAERAPAVLVWPAAADRAAVERAALAIYLVRDLVNTPAEDMGPAELAATTQRMARAHGARCTVTVGDDLAKAGFGAIHAVGRASARPPRLIDLRWGRTGPRVTLVGKGVCFDSGGLDLKTASGMQLMKKDMGGAAHVLALAQMIMAAGLRLRLRVLVPAVENVVSANAFRPLDVLRTRKGITVEVGNTDAEGRLILCDALAEAQRERPDLLIDCATLTGAARVALGPDLPALFSNDDALAEALLAHGRALADPLWRLPLHKGYRQMLDSKIADINNVSDGPFAGAIVAALFLQEFVDPGTPWAHLDLYAWNPKARPGRPVGGEAMGLRALYALIEERAGRGEAAAGGRRRR